MKVLVIDDDEEITEVLRLYLEHLGVNCKTLNNGKDGLLAIQNEYSDLILLDVVMPETTGLDIVQSLKKPCSLEELTDLIERYRKNIT